MTEATRQPEKRRRSGWGLLFKLLLLMGTVVLLFGAALALVLLMAYLEVVRPGTPGEEVDVTIPAGLSAREVGVVLAREGLIEHEAFFWVALRLDKSAVPLKHGPYAIPRGLSALELIRVLQDGPNRALDPADLPDELKVTIPEGLTIAQAAKLFDNPEAFLDAASDQALIARMDVETDTLEGFLMPNTYFFAEKPTERVVVERMLEQFEQEWGRLAQQYPEAARRGILDTLTVASLVEEEARVDDERPKIAAVILNRLKKNMPLQMDSTIQYALGKYGRRILYEDKEIDSPYNTYRYAGLPPGPISNPGVASIRAALDPADVDYLFFVSNADGRTHTFSTTSAEHVRAVRKFRQGIAPQRREQRRQ